MRHSLSFLVIVFLILPAILYGQPLKNHPPTGKLIDAGGHLLHICVTGNGGPTVVLENGTRDFSFIWSFVQPEVSVFTRVVSYDRAGYAWSEPGPLPRSSHQIAFELHLALKNAGIEGPYILVGQSFGGFLVRAFARHYPQEVVGMVLIDVLNEDSKVNVGGGKRMRIREFAKGLKAPLPRVFSENNIVPADSIKLNTRIDPPLDRLPLEIQELQIWAQSHKKFDKAAQQEMEWSPEDVAELYLNKGKPEYTLGNIPLIVLSRGDGGYEGPNAKELEEERLRLQKDLVQLSTNSKHIVAAKSGHNIHVEDPQIVIEAIKEVFNAAVNKLKLK